MKYGLRPNSTFPWIGPAIVAVILLAVVGITSGNSSSHELLYEVSGSSPALANVSLPESMTPVDNGKYIWMEVTAYCACKKCCGPNAQGLTASGKDISYNDGKFVAADTSLLPFGTKLVIAGYDKHAVEVIDRGSAIKGNKLDVYFPTHEQAMQWGRRMIRVRVIED